jgi:CDP-glucose 4,6-dehydratase
MGVIEDAFAGRRVWVTGHTGFKGSWLCEWLLALGAEVWGYSSGLPSEPALFEQLGLAGRVRHELGDVCDAAHTRAALLRCQPDFVFHLAAQSLVRRSYREPTVTLATNVGGTMNVLEAARALTRPCAVVVATSDKCYRPPSPPPGHVEADALGGSDPYSASKAAAEIVTAAWRSSFFGPRSGVPVAVASARAGNVVGGGDWAEDRLVPDLVRGVLRGEPVVLRHPGATRPWQHVLDPLHGYLLLGARLRAAVASGDARAVENLGAAFNFGPDAANSRPVRELAALVQQHWPGVAVREDPQPDAVPEAAELRLDSRRAAEVLGWQPRWNFPTAVAQTIDWYRDVMRDGATAAEVTRAQLAAFRGGSR